MSIEELDDLSSQIAARVLTMQEVNAARTVSTYVHTGSEVRTNQVIDSLLSRGKRVIVPITDKTNRRLLFSELKDPKTELRAGSFGILEPKPEVRTYVPLEQADVILVPGIAWDFRGYRIGYGTGSYDRVMYSLKLRALKIGLSYDVQVLDRIPTTHNDRKVHMIVTERRIINTQQNFGY